MLRDGAKAVQEFRYPQSGVAVPSGWEHIVLGDTAQPVPGSFEDPNARSLDDSRARDLERALEQARKQGIEEGRSVERLEQAARVEQEENRRKEQVRRVYEQYTQELDHLFLAIEPEVVKLALRIAERIVRREVQVDPLVLTGAVRAALGQLADKSKVRVRVPAVDADLWTETLAHLPNLRVEPEVAADKELRPGECTLECDCGVADLGVATQLRGIARTLLGERGTISDHALCEPSEPEDRS